LTQERCTVCAKCTIGSKISLDTPDLYCYVRWVRLKLLSVHLEIVLISTQDRCMVCTEHAIGSEIILDTPNGTPR
jgi:hypothetical protein